jgi:outer membrane protein OmpA-like peptidoglycan-associated protein
MVQRSTWGGTGSAGVGRLHAPVLPLLLLVAAGLAACSSANPIEWYRDATGLSKNDNLGSERNVQNLAAGGLQPYPNLGTVPPPPDRAMSSVDRKKLEEGLLADRAQAKQSDQQLRAASGVPGTATTPIAQGTGALAANAGAPGTRAGAAMGSAPSSSGRPWSPPQHSPPPEPETLPLESPLTSPNVRTVPEGETPQPSPPPPEVVASKTPSSPPIDTTTAVPAEPPPPPEEPTITAPLPIAPLPPSAPETAMAGTPPSTSAISPSEPKWALLSPPPNAPAPSPPRQATATVPLGSGRAGTVSKQLAEIEFANGSMTLTAEDLQRLADIPKLYREKGGALRIVGYGRRGYGADAAQQELASFSKAIDRANLVAQELIRLGLPADKVVVQAAPVGDGLGEDRAEVLLEY